MIHEAGCICTSAAATGEAEAACWQESCDAERTRLQYLLVMGTCLGTA